MSDKDIADIKIALIIISAVIFLLLIGWIWGTNSASNVACHNLGYENGYMVFFPLADVRVVCESGYEMSIPDMIMP